MFNSFHTSWLLWTKRASSTHERQQNMNSNLERWCWKTASCDPRSQQRGAFSMCILSTNSPVAGSIKSWLREDVGHGSDVGTSGAGSHGPNGRISPDVQNWESRCTYWVGISDSYLFKCIVCKHEIFMTCSWNVYFMIISNHVHHFQSFPAWLRSFSSKPTPWRPSAVSWSFGHSSLGVALGLRNVDVKYQWVTHTHTQMYIRQL